VVYKEKKKR